MTLSKDDIVLEMVQVGLRGAWGVSGTVPRVQYAECDCEHRFAPITHCSIRTSGNISNLTLHDWNVFGVNWLILLVGCGYWSPPSSNPPLYLNISLEAYLNICFIIVFVTV